MYHSEQELESALTTPSTALVEDVSAARGDVVILGAGGKMGPTLSVLARRALDEAGRGSDRVFAVSRFSDPVARGRLDDAGVSTVSADLLADDALSGLPDAGQVLFLVGTKFGSATDTARTWAVNAALPDRVARRYRDSAISALSTGNVYPLTSPEAGGSVETDAPAPVGEYAMSCLGRERVFAFGAQTRGTRTAIIRLNYAVDLRYGVLSDIATALLAGEPVDLTTGFVNVVWQGYANEVILRSLSRAHSEVFTVNLTGPELLSVRETALRLAELLDRPARFVGTPAETALLSNAELCFAEFGLPEVTAETLVEWQADWLRRGLPTIGKPTKWAVRDGRF